MSRYIFLIALLLIAGPAYAHRDRILTVHPDGSIPEIPKSFGAVYFRADKLGTAAPHIEFQVGSHRTILPDCLTKIIRSKNSSDIKLSGSWYHDERNLPYYVHIDLYDPDRDPKQSYGSRYELLFNLRSSQLMQFQRLDSDGAGGGRYSAVPLTADCKALLPGLITPTLGTVTQVN